MNSFKPIVLTFILGSLGAYLAWLLKFPIPYLMGPVIVSTFFALCGIMFTVPNPLRQFSFITIGLSVGSNVTPQALSNATQWPLSLLAMLAAIVVVTFSCKTVLNKFFLMDERSSLLASSPGHLSFVLILSVDTNSDTSKVAIIQSIRVLTLTLVTPIIILLFSNSAFQPYILEKSTLGVLSILCLFCLSILSGFVLQKIRFPAPFLIAAMLCSTVTHSTNFTPGNVPPYLEITAFIILGTIIGSRFVNVTINKLKSCLSSGLILTFLSIFISGIAAICVHYLTGIPLAHIFIAFAPGGLETMVAMGSLLKAEPTYIAIHHVSRLFLLALLIPVLINRVKTNKS